jgi:CRISPR/Cas system-associated exonuclease Cas4 (RecB family)
MKLIPVSALSSWVHCPSQFFVSYVLEVEEPPKDVMILGLIKHKLHELMSNEEEKIVLSLKPSHSPAEIFQSSYIGLLKNIVTSHSNSLRAVNVPLVEAFQKALPIAKFEASERASRIVPFLQKGLIGEDLWHALSPKIRTEFSVQSQKLGLKGRIDRLECYEASVVPVELKSGNPPGEGVWDAHRIQAASYALLLEDKFNTSVPEAVVQYVDHNSRRLVVMNPFLREQVVETASLVRSCLENQAVPKGCGRDNCPACLQLKDEEFVQNQLQKADRKL